jgi:hypothetical protein
LTGPRLRLLCLGARNFRSNQPWTVKMWGARKK